MNKIIINVNYSKLKFLKFLNINGKLQVELTSQLDINPEVNKLQVHTEN